MTTTLLFALADTPGSDIGARLSDAGSHRVVACDGDNLVQCTVSEGADLLVCVAASLAPELVQALSAWHGEPPCAVLLLIAGPAPDADTAAQATDLGIHHWEPLAAGPLDAACAAAHARRRREQALRDALAQAREQMEERKWVDRAKGVLMAARGMPEDEAFRLLRGAAMNVNLRVGEISRAVFEAAQWADAMNRAGQLRMLSQRLVRVVAQRLLNMDLRAAAALERQSMQRVRDNLEMLARQCAGTSAAATQRKAARCWDALAAAMGAPRIDAAALQRIDARADDLLQAAERLTEALQVAAGRRALRIVNECGRQRMRVQRVAKESLLAALQPAPVQDGALARRRDAALGEFESALDALEQAPLSSPEIRATQAQIREEWLRLLGGLRQGGSADGLRLQVHSSELMLERLDALTAAYEHSLQVIMS
jgi:AmiR/NasT family two-component response regulator